MEHSVQNTAPRQLLRSGGGTDFPFIHNHNLVAKLQRQRQIVQYRDDAFAGAAHPLQNVHYGKLG